VGGGAARHPSCRRLQPSPPLEATPPRRQTAGAGGRARRGAAQETGSERAREEATGARGGGRVTAARRSERQRAAARPNYLPKPRRKCRPPLPQLPRPARASLSAVRQEAFKGAGAARRHEVSPARGAAARMKGRQEAGSRRAPQLLASSPPRLLSTSCRFEAAD